MKPEELAYLEAALTKESEKRLGLGDYNTETAAIRLILGTLIGIVQHLQEEAPKSKKG